MQTIALAQPINLAPGYVVQSTKTFASIDGSPQFAVTAGVTLDDEGYYEIDVADVDGLATRYPVCIVSVASLSASIASPAAAEPRAFRRLSDLLAPSYPHGRVTPLVQDRSQHLDATVDRAVALQIRARALGDPYAPIASVLARGAGTWRSDGFNLPHGAADLRLAVVVSPPDTVLG